MPPRGFTLVELILALMLAAIVAGLAAPAIDLTEFRVRGAVQEIGTTLLTAQRLAVSRQHDVVVAIDTAAGLRVHEDGDNDGAVDAGEPVRVVALPEDIVFGRGGAAPRPLGPGPITFTRTQAGVPAVTFHRDGSVSEEGGFYLTSVRAERTGSHPGDTHVVEIARSTGRATWYRYTGSTWERRF